MTVQGSMNSCPAHRQRRRLSVFKPLRPNACTPQSRRRSLQAGGNPTSFPSPPRSPSPLRRLLESARAVPTPPRRCSSGPPHCSSDGLPLRRPVAPTAAERLLLSTLIITTIAKCGRCEPLLGRPPAAAPSHRCSDGLYGLW